jgi:hypothetical protein
MCVLPKSICTISFLTDGVLYTKLERPSIPLGEVSLGKLLNLLLFTWGQVQANLFPIRYSVRKALGS